MPEGWTTDMESEIMHRYADEGEDTGGRTVYGGASVYIPQ